ncbi:MAG: aspartate aminotransferase family protein [Gammaproteobacteria bacterium]|nr:aspartate aminotransferase family protein [Gammaproteobacteria bacterium]
MNGKQSEERQSCGREAVLRQYRNHVFPQVKSIHAEPVVVTQGKGCRVRDMDGASYLDFFGGILTISVGHCNDRVTDAIIAQVQRLTHVSSLYPTLPMGELAERLARITPGALEKCFFTASGSEADEMAVMMAQSYTGNSEIIALRHGYSGRTLLAQSLTGNAAWRGHAHLAPGVRHAPAPYCYRCPFQLTYPKCGVACARDVKELIETTTSGRVAGMLAEPVLGVGGFITPPPEYFAIVTEIVREYGGVLIADEVQTGFGRTGKRWGIEHYGLEPDLMTMAKGIANGMPLGALVTTGPVADSFEKSTLSTFGGNPVSCAAANAVLDVLEEERLTERAAVMGERLRDGLTRIRHRFPAMVGDVRGIGLMQAIEFVMDETAGDRTPNPELTADFIEAARRNGLLLGRGGLYANVVRIAPPLTVSADEVDEALTAVENALASLI